MPMHDGQAESLFLDRLLNSMQTALRRRAATVAAIWAAAGAMAVAAGILGADAAFDFGQAARLVLYPLAALVGAGAAAGAALVARRRTPSAFYVARLAEDRRPELKNSLITYLELRSDPQADASMSAAVGRRAARILAESDADSLLPQAALGRPLAVFGAAACLLGATLWLSQGVLFAPWASSAEASLGANPGTCRPGQRPGNDVSEAGAALRSAPAYMADNATPGGPATVVQPGRPGQRPGSHASEAGAALRPAPAYAGDAARAGAPGAAIQQGRPGQRPGNDASETGAALRSALAYADGAARAGAPGAALQPSGQRPGNDMSEAGAAPRSAAVYADDAAGAGAPRAAIQPGRPGQRPGNDMPASAQPGAAVPQTCRPGQRPGIDASEAGAAPRSAAAYADDAAGTGAPDAAGQPGMPGQRLGNGAAGFPKDALDSEPTSKRLIDWVDTRLREGKMSGAFLGGMGMTSAGFRGFVSAWRRTLEVSAPETERAGPAGVAAATVAPGELILSPGGREAGSIAGAASAKPDDRQAVETGDVPVSPRLRGAVAGYFEKVGKLTGQWRGEPGGLR